MLSFLVVWLCFACAFAKDCHFTLELTWNTGSPDGFEREMIFVNDQFPGPTLEIEQGDWVEIQVVNKMPFNTTVHYHGIEQLNTPWADGVPGLTQRPIQPGATYTYKWHANQYGSYFYHAHSRGQIDDGLYGPIIVKPKAGIVKPFDRIAPAEVKLLEVAEQKIKPVILSDWRHTTSQRTWEIQLDSGVESALCMDSLLVNGKGAVDCWSREEIDKFTSPGIRPNLQQNNLTMTNKGCLPPEILELLLSQGTETNIDAIPPEVFDVCTPTQGSREVIKAPHSTNWLALDIISTAGIDTFAFSIDEHPMWIYAVDGHYIEPLLVNALSIANGDRYSVFIRLDKPAGNYGIRLASTALAQLIDTTAVLSYEGGYGNYRNATDDITVTSFPYTNQAGVNTTANVTFFQQARMKSFPPQFPQPAPEPDQTFILSLKTVGQSYIWALNSTPFDHAIDDSSPPLLYQPPVANNPGGNITITTKNNTWIDLIFVVTTINQPPHPIHKHSNKVFVIGQGQGSFNWSSVAEARRAIPQAFNLVTPPFRDGVATIPTTTGPTWLAVRYRVENPGAFLIHCHIQSHLNGGMAMVILDGVDEWPEVPDEYKDV
ncbi:multicopper oxidase [Zopfia rhizophila CBS 207.26]|uniref:Multicopper oxidase n=1 Tax=Zopfia rhizophila CBS 207.26 TaxID=1314779 RepID=A0A6A6ERN2_9PEZI|nr:multicopper oxidase [Zopfia rhizophila CBS 207.26]